MTARRVIIVVHGARTNRTDPGTGALDVSAALARHGFAVLAFDMRGMGASPPAPLSMGYFEQRDVLGAVDFLRSGPLPYPRLGRPWVMGGWGVSMGAATLLLAAAREPALRALVADSAYADILPLLEREIPARSGLPSAVTPGVVLAAWALYGIDYRASRPVDVVARIAPRPLLFIHGAADTFIPPSTARVLATAAHVPHAHVQFWLVPGARHAQGFHVAGQAYVRRVIAFLRASLSGPSSREAEGVGG
jgi:pimeloyl-ACP methyl ester carboxylesterase